MHFYNRTAVSIAVIVLAGCICAFSPGSSHAGLIAHFPLDVDGNSADGKFLPVLEEDVEFEREGATAATGTAAVFNGFSSRIQLDFGRDLNPESFSLAFWAKPYGNTDQWNSAVASLRNQGPDSRGLAVYHTGSSGHWTFSSGNGADSGNLQNLDGPAVRPYEWQHIVVTYDHDPQRKVLFVDGIPVASSQDSIAANQMMPFNIGAGPDYGDAFQFKGEIDDIGLWDSALTAEQIAIVMNLGVGSLDTDPRIVIPRTIVLELTGAEQSFSTQVTNYGQSKKLEISAVSFSGNDASHFTLLSPGAFELSPGESSELKFAFSPAGVDGTIDATLMVVSNDSSQETSFVQLAGLIQDPRIEIADANVDFETVESGGIGTKILVLSNKKRT